VSLRRVAVSEDLRVVNACLAEFDVTMYRGEDGKYRIWGDINRIQDIVFSPCVEAFPTGARRDMDWFFANEVDTRVMRIFKRQGFDVVTNPNEGPGFGFEGEWPSDERMDAAMKETYDWFRVPPHERPAEAPAS
jgi:hypothetical protein